MLNEMLDFSWGIYPSSSHYPFNTILGNKIFDYIQSGLPIISIGSKCNASEFIEENEIGFHIDVKNESEKNLIETFDNKVKNYNIYKEKLEEIISSNQYKSNYKELANILLS